MKLPAISDAEKYVGLYVVDFAGCDDGPGQCGVGYTAEEVGLLLESERFAEAKVYRIHRARPDGTMELAGVSGERFQLESGMFFHCLDEASGRQDYEAVLTWAGEQACPCRATWRLVRCGDGAVVLALVYPAEYEQEMGRWLADSGFRGRGAVDAGVSQVQRFGEQAYETLVGEQLWPERGAVRTVEELLAACG